MQRKCVKIPIVVLEQKQGAIKIVFMPAHASFRDFDFKLLLIIYTLDSFFAKTATFVNVRFVSARFRFSTINR